jgi:two-component system response regulator HydG
MSSGPLLHSADLPSPLQNSAQEQMQQNRPAASRIVPISELERRAILEALARLNGDKLEAARLLGIGKTTLYRKLKEYRLAEFGKAPRDA